MNKKVLYKGTALTVRGGAWLDINNSCFYTVIDTIEKYRICKDDNGVLFALPYSNI